MRLVNLRKLLTRFAALALCAVVVGSVGVAQQQQQSPLTNAEFLAAVRQLPRRPDLKEQLISEIRRRGIGFTLTGGLRAFVATKSGNDEELRRVLEEAERRFLNPKEATPLPSEAEAADVLTKARAATLEATGQMPDFVVKQLVTRSYALENTQNWKVSDRLVVGVSYRLSEGEQYRLLAVNGVAGPAATASEKGDYKEAGGANSTGEFVSILKGLFEDESHTEFKALDTDTLRGRRALVYTYDIKKTNSKWLLDHGDSSIIAAHRGKVWIDREKFRVLRVESTSYDVPATFAITASNVAVDYDWVTIPGQGEYLLPSRSVIVMTVAERSQSMQFRNEIRFRNYQKFGTELKILDDDIIDEDVPKEAPPPKPPENRKP
jgi:hypothetical protein